MSVANSRFASSGAIALIGETALAVEGQIDIQNIPATYRHLWIVGTLFRGVGANLISDNLNLRFNADGGATYDMSSIRDQNAVLSAVGATGADRLRWGQGLHVAPLSANQVALIELMVFHYARADRFKVMHCLAGWRDPAAGTDRNTKNLGTWRSLAAINRITLLGDAAQTDLGAASRVAVYGVN